MDTYSNWGRLLLPEGQILIADLWQLALLAAIFAVTRRLIGPERTAQSGDYQPGPINWIRENRVFLVTWLLSTIFFGGFLATDLSDSFFRFFAILGGAWFVIGIASSLLKEPFWARSVAGFGYLLSTAIAIASVDGVVSGLKSLQFQAGNISLNAWGILTGSIAFAFTMWTSLGLARFIEKQIQTVPRLSASLKVLTAKIVRIALIFIATMIALGSMGINLSSLTVLGGAIGLGLGFGLQKVVSNFVSGILLLLDNSVKPGDVIEIDGTYGWINNLRARYASVITRDGTEHLIPNEDLITQRVINWSFTDDLVRIRIPIGVSYNSDPHECIRLILEAANGHERVLSTPKPVCLFTEFGDSSLNFQLRFWIADPANGVGSVKSHVLLKVWDTFKENNIEIPFPQRDLHIRSSDVDFVKRDVPDPE